MLFSLHLILERWKWNNEYQVWVSTLGNVRTSDRTPCKTFIAENGYCAVKIENKLVLVHRLVMKTWKPCKKMGQLTIDHLNHNKRDNALKNLEWVTREENQKRAIEDYFTISKNGEAKPVFSPKQKPKIKINDKIYTPNEAAKLIFQIQPGINFKKALRKVNLTVTDGLPRSYGGVRFEAVII